MKPLHILTIMFLVSCEDWCGSPVPLGDDFEDHWSRLCSLSEPTIFLCASNAEPDCFFALSSNRIWQVKDTLVQITYSGEELTCLAASFFLPEQLLCGTTTSAVLLVDLSGDTSRIFIPGVSYINHVAFDPLNAVVFYAGDDNLILKRDSTGADFDTVFYSPDNIYDLIVSGSGILYIATAVNICHSTDGGVTWDTIFTSAGSPISQITLDQQENIYAYCGNAIFRTTDKVNWTSFFTDSTVWEDIAGIADGLIIAREIESRKIKGSGQSYDISHGIVVDFGYSSALIAVNGNNYLFAGINPGIEETVFFSFGDTSLPP